MHPVGIPYEN